MPRRSGAAGVRLRHNRMSKPKPPQTVAALITAIDQVVEAIDGPARAFFELPVTETGGDPLVLRVTYKKWLFGVVGSADYVESLLVQYFWANFIAAFTEEELESRFGAVLFWRTRPQLSEYTDAHGRVCTRISARFEVPGKVFGVRDASEGAYPQMLN